jgi:cyclic beta-1,2-glucan synthetase
MYRIGVESLLGISTRGNALHIDPCIPKRWPGYEVLFRRAGTSYRIIVENPDGVVGVAR